MWTRGELKSRAKVAYKRNMIVAIVAALIFALVIGKIDFNNKFNSPKDSYDIAKKVITSGSYVGEADDDEDIEDLEEAAEELKEALTEAFGEEEMQELADEIAENASSISDTAIGIIVLALITVFFICMFIYLIIYIVKALVLNVFEVGCQKFFVKDLSEKASLNEVLSGFTDNYGNRVKIMFLKDLFTFLWTLLLVIPGIIKRYEYRMVPYITALNPDLSSKEVFALSKKMMSGNKWNAFVLDLSFIGWKILNVFTCGILGIVYINPYQYHTNAALFEALYWGKNEFIESNNDFEIYQEV